ncbi:aspartate aminotransferase family protein [Sinorhizobium medicae]|uniref:aspartate aminotransferase family protein n=1 Tax=Sinorhizobium medicae TaxID=110321 RepID=UPI001295210D|nr:aspartate aminotransferase family protein [Sinorhizobium medicae]MDX0967912.1 aminotransferase class III-fold pyridoxal phosphate-dependent enzyme [Sinorhizobium medicae]MQV49893.1 aminotransferase class III-fold pyridoxal phosphate-dependent enzyme [Sinorhizobium medicae]MQV51233.1 aminotransferase class III-fold pyridoxal phosphate-dependent enzyme [Sinorhizobium medicae]MQV75321.1 aminotransferase class III-fold pyridoxal phosphate-dependent enzyme [Sinorhizobium medicae]WQO88525.1 aspar
MRDQMLPNRSAEDLRATDLAHHLHPFTDHTVLRAEGGPRVITDGDGVYLWDTEGRRLLDGMAGLWCVNVGYGRKELSEVARQQMDRLAYYNTFFKTSHEPVIHLAEKLATLTPEGVTNFLFSNSGSEANDTAIRLVRSYWAAMEKPERQVVISREYAYHGSTLAGASLCGLPGMHGIAGLPIAGIAHATGPYAWAAGHDSDDPAYGEEAADALEAKILEIGPGNVAAFIGEPVMGAGGVITPPPGYWARVQEICRKHDILIICDEVICGFGRTGEWFGADRYEIVPDIMCMAKGLSSGYLPISAVGVGKRVADTLRMRPGIFSHGFTYSGHPVAAAVALKNINIIEEEGLVEHVRDIVGPALTRRLGILTGHPLVGQVRGVGAMWALELTSDKATRAPFAPVGSVATRVRNLCFERGLATRAVREGLVFAPPLIITEAQVDELADILASCLDTAAAEL